MKFIDTRIADAELRLSEIDRKIEELKAEALSVRGELRAYRIVKENQPDAPPTEIKRTDVDRVAAPQSGSLSVSTEPARIGFSRLTPVWRVLFSEMVKAYPKAFTQEELATIAKEKGLELGPSFRTALWHHAVRNNLVRQFDDDTFVANAMTAKKAGVRWTVEGDTSSEETNAPQPDNARDTTRAFIESLVKDSKGLTVSEIVEATGAKGTTVRGTLWKLRHAGVLQSQGGRWFAKGSENIEAAPLFRGAAQNK
jgi:hypothetical protein